MRFMTFRYTKQDHVGIRATERLAPIRNGSAIMCDLLLSSGGGSRGEPIEKATKGPEQISVADVAAVLPWGYETSAELQEPALRALPDGGEKNCGDAGEWEKFPHISDWR